MMKDLLEEHRETLTSEEDRAIWSTIEAGVAPRPRRTGRFWVPVGAVSLIAFLAALFVEDRLPIEPVRRDGRAEVVPDNKPVQEPELRSIPYIPYESDRLPSPTGASLKESAPGEPARAPGPAASRKRNGLQDLAELKSRGDGENTQLKLRGKRSQDSHDLNSLPQAISPEAPLRAGVIAKGGELHYRGGRAGGLGGLSVVDGISVSPAPTPPNLASVDALSFQLPPGVSERMFGDNARSNISVGGTDPVNGQPFDAMFFEHYGVNPFIDPEEDRFATFAVDVDNASYSMTRAYLDRGELPPKEAVRVEEFVNAFRHDYPAPASADLAGPGPTSEHGTFAIHLDAAPSPFGDGLKLLRVGLKGREIDVSDRKPAVLTFVVDVSGSMAQENRLELVKKSLLMLLDQMTSGDQVGLVVYGSQSRTILDHTSVQNRERIEAAIRSLQPEGATNAEAGLLEGYRLADRAFRKNRLNRVILCSDGVANVGNTGAEEILKRIRNEAGRGIELTAIGFGMGNYNDVLMEKLADQGDGNYYYVDELQEARRVFVENLTGTLQTIARQTKIQVEFSPQAVRRYRLLGYENRDVADRDFRNDAVDAGEVGAGHEVTALFEVRLIDRASGRDTLGVVRIRYEDPQTGAVTEEARGILVQDIRQTIRETPESFRIDAAVAEFAEILRQSYWAKNGRLATVADYMRETGQPRSETPQIAELRRLIDTAARLWPVQAAPQSGDAVRPRWEPGSDER